MVLNDNRQISDGSGEQASVMTLSPREMILSPYSRKRRRRKYKIQTVGYHSPNLTQGGESSQQKTQHLGTSEELSSEKT